MTKTHPTLAVAKIRGRYHVTAGRTKLSRGFKTEAEAQASLNSGRSLYQYWAESTVASVENAEWQHLYAGSARP